MAELADLITGFQNVYPEVKVSLHSGYNNEIRTGLDNGQFDIGLLLEPANAKKYDFIRLKMKERFGCLVHKQSKFAQYETICHGDLSETPILTILDECIRRELRAWSGQYVSQMNNYGKYNLTYNAALLVQAKESVMTSLDLPQTYKDLKFIPLSPKLELTSILAWRNNVPQNKVLKAFITYLREKV